MQKNQFQPYLNHIIEGNDLTQQQAEEAFLQIMSGDVIPVQIASFLTSLHQKGEAIDEIVGAVKALRHNCVKVDVPEGAIDVCGTGGDHSGTYNISTAVSFIVAAADVPVAKHGNKALTSKSGSADVLSALGVNVEKPKEVMEKSLKDHNIGFFMAPLYHPAMKYVGQVRKELGFRTIFNLLGPLINPGSVPYQLIGVFDQKWAKPMVKTLKTMGSHHVLIAHGKDGLDEVTTTSETYITEFNGEDIIEYEIHPNEYGFAKANRNDLKGGDATENAQAIEKLFVDNTENPFRDIVLLNAGVSLYAAKKVRDIKEGIELSVECIKSGKAYEKLQQLRQATA